MANRSLAARRWRATLLWAASAVALYGIVVGFIAPPIAKKMIAESVGERWGRVARIDELTINPFTLALTIKGMRVMESDGHATFASFDRLDVDGSIVSIRHLAPVADAMTLAGLKVNLVRDSDSHYNFTDILERIAKAPKGPLVKTAEYSLSNIRITSGRVDFDDRPKGKKHEITGIDIAIPTVSTLPAHLKDFVQPKFSAQVNGAPLRFTGETLPFENSLRTQLAIDLESLDVPGYVEYSPAALPVKIDSAKLDAHLLLRFVETADRKPSIDVAGKLALRDVRLSSPEEPALASVSRIDLELASLDPLAGLMHVGSLRISQASASHDRWTVAATEAKEIDVDAGKKNVRIESLATRDGVLALTRRPDGSIEIPNLPARPQGNTGDSAEPWVLKLGKLSLQDYKLALADASVKPPANHRVTIGALEIAGLTTEQNARATMSAKLQVGKSGAVDLESSFGLKPLSLDARIDARRIDLVAFRPYIDAYATVALKSADASAKGTVSVTGEGDAMRIAYSGAASVANVASVETASHEDLVNWDSIGLAGVDFRWTKSDPLHLAVSAVEVKKAYARVVVTPEGKINLQQLKGETQDSSGVAAPVREPTKPRDIRIDHIALVDSRLDFTDHFIRPNYSANVRNLHGSVTNLSSDAASRGIVDLQGSYGEASPVAISGTINPLRGDLFLDITASAKDIGLPALTAYSERYAGYGITQGKLELDVRYQIDTGKLEGRNKIVLEQLVFGEKVESPEATKLPVLFAVNLLKDSKGVINVTLPISGSLSDPQFAIGDLIMQVVAGLFRKAVTSPFSLLSGGASGSGAAGEDLAFVDFEPGRDDIAQESEKKLQALARALLDRPAINLQLTPRVDDVKDLQALRRAALLQKVKAAGGATYAPGEYPRYLKLVFDREKIAKPESKDGSKELTVAQMEALLLERIEVGPDALNALAIRRSENVRNYLVQQAHLPVERIHMTTPDASPGTKQMSRVEFTLG